MPLHVATSDEHKVLKEKLVKDRGDGGQWGKIDCCEAVGLWTCDLGSSALGLCLGVHTRLMRGVVRPVGYTDSLSVFAVFACMNTC